MYGIYARVAHSQWMLYGLVLPTLLFTIYMLFSTYRSGKEGRRQEREQRYMLEAMKDVARSMSGAQLHQQQQQMVPYQPTSTRAMLPAQQPIVMLAPDTSYGVRQLEYDDDHVVPARRRLHARRRRRGRGSSGAGGDGFSRERRKRNGIPHGDQLVTVL